jgi:transposase InsO family protein
MASFLGLLLYWWRTVEARDRGRTVDCRQVHGQASARVGPDLEDVLAQSCAGIGAMDFLVVPTINFRLLFVLVILRHERRRLISPSVANHPTAEWIARQTIEAFPWDSAPTHLIRDHDASYGLAVTRRLAAMGIGGHPIAPRSPWQNGHAERLIGSIRRECLDHVVVFGEAHLAKSSRPMLPITTTYSSYSAVRYHRHEADPRPTSS